MLGFRRAAEAQDVSGSRRSRPKARYSSGRDSLPQRPKRLPAAALSPRAHRPIKVVVEAGRWTTPAPPTGGAPPATDSPRCRRADAHARGPTAHVAEFALFACLLVVPVGLILQACDLL